MPLTYMKKSELYNWLMYLFTAINALQGVFIFIHFVVTVQFLLKQPRKKANSPSHSGTRLIKSSSN